MILFGSKQKQREQEDYERFQYEAAVKKVCEKGQVTLAIARMSYWDGLSAPNFWNVSALAPQADCLMNGILHERTGSEMRVGCNVHFEDFTASGDIGRCRLTDLADDRKGSPERRRLKLDVWICDPGREWRYKAYRALQDAAVSGRQFCHFMIYLESLNPEDVLAELRAKGEGPYSNVRAFSMSPEITLPKAPHWGWKRDFE